MSILTSELPRAFLKLGDKELSKMLPLKLLSKSTSVWGAWGAWGSWGAWGVSV